MGPVLVSVAAEQPTYLLGEAVWVGLVLRNDGAEEHQGTLDLWDDGPLRVRVTNDRGRALSPSRHRPRPGWGAAGPGFVVPPGRTVTVANDVASHAWFEGPGTWVVQVLHPFEGPGEPAPDDARWQTTPVTIVAPQPEELLDIVLAHPIDRWSQPARYDAFDALGHPVFVPVLEELAAGSTPVRPDERALRGLAACPCVDATAALLRLHAGFADAGLRANVAEELLYRMPIPPTEPYPQRWRGEQARFAERAWDPTFDAELLARARAALTRDDVAWGARVIARIGSEADVPRLAEALDRVLLRPVALHRPDVARGALWEALRAFPDAPPPASVTREPQLVVASSRPMSGALLEDALRSDVPWIVITALQRLDAVPGPEARRWIALHLGSPERRIAEAAYACVIRHPDPSYREALVERLAHADAHELPLARGAAAAVGLAVPR